MTPEQIDLVESTAAAVDLEAVTDDFYRRAFEADAEVSAMFTTDPAVQRTRFAAELAVIVASIRDHDAFLATTGALGARHRGYGVHAVHYRVMGDALLGALAAALGDRWTGEVAEAWQLAYNLTAETMMLGASDAHRPG
jgi:methyl-accepting chemotaxis protein/nitric oxide dioxygenase